MIAAVADTHTALWHLFDDPRLSRRAGDFINAAAVQRRNVAISAISLAEVVYLIEKKRVPLSAYDVLFNALNDPEHVLVEVACTAAIVAVMRGVPRNQVPDMPDRIVAATAVHLEVPVISRDGKIHAAGLNTVW